MSIPAMATTQKVISADILARQPESLWRQAVRAFFRQRSAVIGLSIVVFLILLSIFAPLIAPYNPEQILIGVENVQKREAPCIHLLGCPRDRPQHIMGIDGNVRDVFSRVVFGARVSLYVGVVTVGFAIVAGAFLGAIAGFIGGATDHPDILFPGSPVPPTVPRV